MHRRLLLLVAGLGVVPPAIDAGTARRASFDFRYDLLPVLHRQGCGSAYCHGSATGAGGFKLSLFASDPEADFAAITRELGGRRLDLTNPAHSLLLRKPSLMGVDHGGGRRLETESHEYRTLETWIAKGAPYRSGAPRTLEHLTLKRTENQLQAIAEFRDAHGTYRRDVTALTSFASTDDRVVGVDAHGRLTRHQPGAVRLLARYVTQNAERAVTQPFTAHLKIPPRKPIANPLFSMDAEWYAQLERLGLPPAPRARPHTLARRLYLDLAGRLPTPAELQAFLKLPEARRVGTTAETLLTTADFAQKWGRHLAEWLEVSFEDRPQNRVNYRAVQARFAAELHAGKSLLEIFERVLVTDRSLIEQRADPRDRAELVSRAFLGVRIGCARCHNSPVDRWEQKHHLAFSALFTNQRPNPKGGMQPGVFFDPETGKPIAARVLPSDDGWEPATTKDHARRVADFILKENAVLFGRNIANRVFAELFGRGFFEPVDDQRLSNPPIQEGVLATAARMAAAGQLRALIQFLVDSELYQVSSAPRAANDAAAKKYFARREAHAMRPHIYINAVEKALQIRSTERLTSSPLARQLAILNSDFLHSAVKSSLALETIAIFALDEKAQLRDVFLLLLSREPTAEETEAFLPALQKGPAHECLPDLAFALLASREFGSIR